MTRAAIITGFAMFLFAGAGRAQEITGVQKTLNDLEVQGSWIYNDLDQGFAEAKKTGKPMLVVFR